MKKISDFYIGQVSEPIQKVGNGEIEKIIIEEEEALTVKKLRR